MRHTTMRWVGGWGSLAGAVGTPLAQTGYPQRPNIGPIEMLIGVALTLAIFGVLGFLTRKVEK